MSEHHHSPQTDPDSPKERIYRILIDEESAGISIEQYLRTHGFSHRLTARMKRDEQAIICNNRRERASRLLCTGDILMLRLPSASASAVETGKAASDALTDCSSRSRSTPKAHIILPWDHPLEIVYEDDDLLVVDKPAGMPVHPSRNNYSETLANAYAAHMHSSSLTFHCITRLDRDTSGLVLIAKNALSCAVLSEEMKSHRIKKQYLAICEGMIMDAGMIDAPIGRAPGNTIARCIDFNKGDAALTSYEPLQQRSQLSQNGLTLLKVLPLTGRTHQIRVHLSYIGHPIIGDFLYHPDYRYISRQALHASSLSFRHPLTQELIHLEAPLPEDMRFLMDSDAAHAHTDTINR